MLKNSIKSSFIGLCLIFSLSSNAADNMAEEGTSKTEEIGSETVDSAKASIFSVFDDDLGTDIAKAAAEAVGPAIREAIDKAVALAMETIVTKSGCLDGWSQAQLEEKECISKEQLSNVLMCLNSYVEVNDKKWLSTQELSEKIEQESQETCATGYLCGCEQNKNLSSAEKNSHETQNK